MKSYPHVVHAVMSTPWAVLNETAATIRGIVASRVAGEQLSREDIDARVGNGQGSRGVYMAGSVAVIPIYGVIIPRATLFSDISGGTSVQSLRNSFLEAIDDEEVSAIVFDVNSPGGMVDLVPELAEDIRAKRGTKPIVAVANTLCASAAYWLASQADELYVTESGDAGSIGVITMHEDMSKALEAEGVDVTLITAGKYKDEGNPFEPLGAEAKAALQRRVDEAYGLFVSDVAAGRGIAEADVRNGLGEGRLLKAKAALAAGLVDGIQTFEATVRGLAAPSRRARGGTRAEAPEPEENGELLEQVRAASAAVAATFEDAGSYSGAVDAALRALDSVVTSSEALRAMSGRKREQLATLVERAEELLVRTTPKATDADGLDLDIEAELAAHEAHFRLSPT